MHLCKLLVIFRGYMNKEDQDILCDGPGDLENRSNRSGMKFDKEKRKAEPCGWGVSAVSSSEAYMKVQENVGIWPDFGMIGLSAGGV